MKPWQHTQERHRGWAKRMLQCTGPSLSLPPSNPQGEGFMSVEAMVFLCLFLSSTPLNLCPVK